MRVIALMIGIPIIAVLFIIGWSGIKADDGLTEGSCNIQYTYYYIEPVIKNSWECHNPFWSSIPCGTDSRLTKHNAQIQLIQCLCENTSYNQDRILNYYNNKLDRYFDNEVFSKNLNFICTEGAKQKFRF